METRVSTFHRKGNLPPRQQPGGDVLSDIQNATFKWARGQIYSDEALSDIAEIVKGSDYFEGLLGDENKGRSGKTS